MKATKKAGMPLVLDKEDTWQRTQAPLAFTTGWYTACSGVGEASGILDT
jgi:hypothetical protein